jgi:hypothetical protein
LVIEPSDGELQEARRDSTGGVVLDIRSAWRNDAFVSLSAEIDAGRPPGWSTELVEDAPVRRDRLRESAAQGAGKGHGVESLASGETSADQSEANRLRATGDLFQRDKSVISRHIRNVFEEGELRREAVVAQSATTAVDGKSSALYVETRSESSQTRQRLSCS